MNYYNTIEHKSIIYYFMYFALLIPEISAAQAFKVD
jgi:hypothetical protein